MKNNPDSNIDKKSKIKSTKKGQKSEEKKDEEKKAIEDKYRKRKKPVKLIKCKFCQNPIPYPKKTLNFSCQHQLCGVCISRCILRDYFKCITDKSDLITLYCNECLKNNVLEVGTATVQMSFIVEVLKDTYKTRNKIIRNKCTEHDETADYCLDCKNWYCNKCKQEFHNNKFPSHSSFYPEEPFSFQRCPRHMDRGLELYCVDCQKDICKVCAFKGEEHEKHKKLSMNEFKRKVIKDKKKFRYQDMDEFDNYLEKIRLEFKKIYQDIYKQKSQLVSEITTILQKFYDNFFIKKEKMEKFIENYFNIIRACYFNYFKDMEEKEPRIGSLKFIESINKEFSNFDFDSKFTKDLEKIKEELELIQPQKFFEYKLRFFNHNFECIKAFRDKDINDQIYCLTQLKNGNIITGGSKGILTEWDINTGLKIDSFNAHKGNIYSIIETKKGSIVSAGSDSWINIWNLKEESKEEPKIVNLIKEKPKPKPIIEIKTVIQEPPKESEINIENNNINNNNIIKLNQSPNIQINELSKETNNNQININAHPPNLFQPNLNYVPPNIKLPNSESTGQSNIQNLNQPQITIHQASPDGGYSGNGNFNAYPNNLSYGSNGISQNNNNNTNTNIQINPINIENNNNANNTNINEGINNNQTQINNGNSTELSGNQGNNNDNTINNNNNNENTNNNINLFNNNNSEVNPSINNNINNNINNININNNIGNNNNNNNESNININTNTNININNQNINLNPFAYNNTAINTNPPVNIQQIPEERKEEEKKEEEKKEDDDNPYNDFEESDINKANPPKKPSSINENKLLESQKYTCTMKLHGHEDEVNYLLENSDEHIISCSKDGYILIWNLEEPEKPKKIEGHKNGVGCGLELKKNNLITGGGDALLKIWNLESENPLDDVEILKKKHRNAIFSICKIIDNMVASASCDKSILLWDLNLKTYIQVFDGHGGYIWNLITVEMKEKDENFKDKKLNLLASCSSDKSIKFWDLEEKRCIKTIYGHDREITSLSKSHDGNIISGSLDSFIKIWKL